MGFDIHKAVTTRGYSLGLVVSALQKAIRRGDVRLAGYWALEMWASGFDQYLWKRLLVISAEDCWGILTQEVAALQSAYEAANKGKGKDRPRVGRIFVSKAVILLCLAKKSRDADHLQNFVYDQEQVAELELLDSLAEAARELIPEYAFDCHTPEGRSRGKTQKDFFRDEQAALQPKQRGLFDDLAAE